MAQPPQGQILRPNDPVQTRESRALAISAVVALLFAVVGVIWGLAVSSQLILFDGLYSLIGFVLSWFGLRAAALVEKGPTAAYPFGREALAPLIVSIQALVLIGTFGYAVFDAIGVLILGGADTQVGPALIYAIVTLLASVLTYQAMVRAQEGSDLVTAEALQWHASVLIGIAMTLGFALAIALSRTQHAYLAPYMDPALVLVAALMILPAPIRMLNGAFRELLEGTPAPEITEPIRAAIENLRTDLALPAPNVRIGKLGRKVYLELDFVVPDDGAWRVDDADRIRRRLNAALARPGQLLWINVELHTDPDWDAEAPG